jgi:hypothetical protein
MKQAWCLATNLTEVTAGFLKALYGLKACTENAGVDGMRIPRHQGPALRHGDRIDPPQHARPARAVVAAECIAIALLTLLGAVGEAARL